MKERQQKAFDDIVNVKHKIQGLAGYLQNDFEIMLEDGTATKIDIGFAIFDMNESFDNVIAELNRLREESEQIMRSYVFYKRKNN